MNVTMSSVFVPGWKISRMPRALRPGMSPSGMMPPANTSTSSAPCSFRSRMTSGKIWLWAPLRMLMPSTRASSCTTAATICWGVWRRPVSMTSMPASRKARATTFAPRSGPSSRGLAMTTRMGAWLMGTPVQGLPVLSLPQRLVKANGCRLRQVQAAMVVAHHGDPHQMVVVGLQEVIGKPHRLLAEHEPVAPGPGHLSMPPGALGAEEPQAFRGGAGEEILPVLVVRGLELLPVVQAGPTQVIVAGVETQRMDQVEFRPVVHAEAADASGILRNLGLMQDDMEHGRS